MSLNLHSLLDQVENDELLENNAESLQSISQERDHQLQNTTDGLYDDTKDPFQPQPSYSLPQSTLLNFGSDIDDHFDSDDGNNVKSIEIDTSTVSPRSTTTRNNIKSQILNRKARKEAHLEMLRYPGWNYFLNLHSESTILWFSAILTFIRLLIPYFIDLFHLFSYFFVSTTDLPNSMPSPSFQSATTTTVTTTTINKEWSLLSLFTSNLFSLGSIPPFTVSIWIVLIYVSIPPLKRYIQHHQQLNINKTMPYPPPVIWLTHSLIGLFLFLFIDLGSFIYHEYRHLFRQYFALPPDSLPLSSILGILFQCFFILIFLILILLQICLTLLMLTECYCIYQSQQWWNNYSTAFQTKKRCFILGNYNQINPHFPSLSMNLRLYYRYFASHFTHRLKKFYYTYFSSPNNNNLVLQEEQQLPPFQQQHDIITELMNPSIASTPSQNSVFHSQPPIIFPYPSYDPVKFRHFLKKRFPNSFSLQHKHKNKDVSEHEYHHEHEHGHDAHDKKKDETIGENQSLLSGDNDTSTSTLVIPCVVLPPYIMPITFTPLKLFYDGFVQHLLIFIKEHRESVTKVQQEQDQIRQQSHQNN